MNAIFLGVAALGALAAVALSPMERQPIGEDTSDQDKGSMTHTVKVDPKTGETTEINVIAFDDH